MNKVIIYNAPAKLGSQEDIVALWKQAVLGDASKRQAFLLRIMPPRAHELGSSAEADVLQAYRKPSRAAA